MKDWICSQCGEWHSDHQRQVVKRMLEADPDLNLYLLAFENPELEEAALALASELSVGG